MAVGQDCEETVWAAVLDVRVPRRVRDEKRDEQVKVLLETHGGDIGRARATFRMIHLGAVVQGRRPGGACLPSRARWPEVEGTEYHARGFVTHSFRLSIFLMVFGELSVASNGQ